MDSTSIANIGEIGNRDGIQDTPDIVTSFTFHFDSNLLADPRVSAITANDVFGMDGFNFAVIFNLEIFIAIKLAEKTVSNLTAKLFWVSIIIGKSLDLDCNWVSVCVVNLGFINVNREGSLGRST